MTAPAYSLFEFLLTPVETDTTILSGGSVYFYSPGTTETTDIHVYLDKDGSSEANNPYTLDADGTAQLYGSGSYRIVIKDVNGVTQYDRDNYYLSAGPDYVSSVSIGDYASLSAAVTAIGATSTRLLINEAITVTADLTVPVNIVLERIQPGSITVNPGVTLTIVAAPISDASEWFLGTGTVSVTGYPQDQAWWGESQRIDTKDISVSMAPVLPTIGVMQNGSFTASVATKALTVALKGTDGNDPSSSNPVKIAFRSSTITSAPFTTRTVTAALSVVAPSGATFGFTSALAGRLYIWAIDNAGTVELALSRTADIFQESNLVSTTAIGTGSDSATTMYSTSARTNVACRCIGYIDIVTGATAGEWDNAPTKLQVMGAGVKRTGDVVQVQYTSTAAAATITDNFPLDDTIPQKTEGGEILTLAIIPTSAVNKLLIESLVSFYVPTATDAATIALFQDTTANALAASVAHVYTNTFQLYLQYSMTSGTAASTTFKIRGGCVTQDFVVNSYDASHRAFGGVDLTMLKITEIMA